MKKLIALAAAAMMLLSLFTACGKEPAANNDNDTEKTTTFTVGFDAEFPPYGYQDENGEYVGFDLDLAAEVCTRNGWELVKKPINWDSKDMELNTEVISCIWNGFTMQGREDKYTWSEAYVDNSQVIVVKKDSGIATYADLAGKIVAVQADSSALAALTENEDGSNAENIALAESFKQMVEVPDYNTAFLNLEAGAVDAIAMDIGVAQYQISQRGDEFVILDGTIASETYGIGFKLGNTELRDAVQKGVLAGYPLVNLKATLYDGSYHPVDSNEMAFKTAAQLAYKDGIPRAKPTILEPIGLLKVTIPDANLGDIMSDISSKRRGTVLGMTAEDGMQIVEAEVPMAEMSSYTIDLRSMTQGRGSFTCKFVRYEEAPGNVQQKVIEEAKALADAE